MASTFWGGINYVTINPKTCGMFGRHSDLKGARRIVATYRSLDLRIVSVDAWRQHLKRLAAYNRTQTAKILESFSL